MTHACYYRFFWYGPDKGPAGDRKSTRLNSSHLVISYAVFCLKKKKKKSIICSNALHSHYINGHRSDLSYYILVSVYINLVSIIREHTCTCTQDEARVSCCFSL